MFTNIHMFFTTWVVLLLVFHDYTHRYIDLFFLTFVTLFCGLYVSLVSPRKYSFVLFGDTYFLTGIDRFFAVDIVFHIIAFIFVYSRYHSYYTPASIDGKFLSALLIIAAYLILVDAKRQYMTSKPEMYGVLVLSVIVYTMLFVKR